MQAPAGGRIGSALHHCRRCADRFCVATMSAPNAICMTSGPTRQLCDQCRSGRDRPTHRPACSVERHSVHSSGCKKKVISPRCTELKGTPRHMIYEQARVLKNRSHSYVAIRGIEPTLAPFNRPDKSPLQSVTVYSSRLGRSLQLKICAAATAI